MFPQFSFNENEILAFALVLIRVSGFIVSWPVFSVYSVPNQAKVLFAVLLSLLMFPSLDRTGLESARLGDEIVWLAGREVFIGVSLGFVTRLFFFALSVGGNLISTYMGLSSGQVFNPSLGVSSTTIEQFYLCMVTLIFLALNGHHYFIEGLAKSFELVPLAMEGVNIGVFKETSAFVQDVMLVGIQVSAPIMVAIFMLNVFMGILGRTVPQINVLVTSMSINAMAGFLVIIISLPALVPETESMLLTMTNHLFQMLKAL